MPFGRGHEVPRVVIRCTRTGVWDRVRPGLSVRVIGPSRAAGDRAARRRRLERDVRVRADWLCAQQATIQVPEARTAGPGRAIRRAVARICGARTGCTRSHSTGAAAGKRYGRQRGGSRRRAGYRSPQACGRDQRCTRGTSSGVRCRRRRRGVASSQGPAHRVGDRRAARVGASRRLRRTGGQRQRRRSLVDPSAEAPRNQFSLTINTTMPIGRAAGELTTVVRCWYSGASFGTAPNG